MTEGDEPKPPGDVGVPSSAYWKARHGAWWYKVDGRTVLIRSGPRPASDWTQFVPRFDYGTGEVVESPLPDLPFRVEGSEGKTSTAGPRRLTDWGLDQLRYSAEQRDIVDVAGKDLLALVVEVAAGRRRASQPYAPLVVLPPIGGLAAWLWTGDWRWVALGVLLLLVGAVIGTTMDSAHRARSYR